MRGRKQKKEAGVMINRKQIRRGRQIAGTVAAAAIGLLLMSGAVAPSANAQIFMSKEQEKKIGAQEHPKILKSFGGVYKEGNIGAYVAEIGGRIASNSDEPDLGYTVTVLNSPVVNAFALPGGYVYVTRGLMALANSEAELAGVIGHEVGHVTERHTAKRYDRAIGTSIVGGILGAVVGGGIVNDLIGLGGQLYLTSFSRNQEYEADLVGVRVLSRAGYDPFAQSDFLASMNAQAELHAKIVGQGGRSSRVDFFSTHPNTQKRVIKAIEEAETTGLAVRAMPRRREEFLTAVNGMLHGDDPNEGFVRGETFSHPNLRLTFTVPKGFVLQNSSQAVVARAQNGSIIQFDGAGAQGYRGSIGGYLTNVFARQLKVRLSNVETFSLNGLPAATGITRMRTNSGSGDLRLVAVQWSNSQIFRFILFAPSRVSSSMQAGFQQTIESFRRLSAQEAGQLKPLRLRVVRARSGDTVQKFASRMAFNSFQTERFQVLNGLSGSQGLQDGRRYKIVTE